MLLLACKPTLSNIGSHDTGSESSDGCPQDGMETTGEEHGETTDWGNEETETGGELSEESFQELCAAQDNEEDCAAISVESNPHNGCAWVEPILLDDGPCEVDEPVAVQPHCTLTIWNPDSENDENEQICRDCEAGTSLLWRDAGDDLELIAMPECFILQPLGWESVDLGDVGWSAETIACACDLFN